MSPKKHLELMSVAGLHLRIDRMANGTKGIVLRSPLPLEERRITIGEAKGLALALRALADIALNERAPADHDLEV